MYPLYFGVAYYPEHWPRERWPEDIHLMKAAGVNVVRMGEFAWSTLETAPGDFHFDWLEEVIHLLAEAGIQTVLGTPTAAPPAWLVYSYPEMLAIDEFGRRVQFGNRCHYCVNSPEFHEAVRRLVGALAKRFGSSPHVIGWQIDNEYNRVCYCDRCQAQFQEFLRQRYGSLEELNTRWATAYWSQTYSDWSQIPVPIGPHNPALMLEFRRFVTASYARFQKIQLDELRPHLPPHVWTTHNFMGWFGAFDHYVISRDLDLASWDWYIGSGHHDYLRSGAMHDLTRGFKRKNFWLMETQPGHVNWAGINNELHPGEARAMAWHAIAHGADALLYWQWRSAPGGQEHYHGTLIDQSGQPRPFYEEAQQIGREFARLSPLLANTTIRTPIALLHCYESRWSMEAQPHHKDFDYITYLNHWYRPLATRNLEVDILSADEALDGYMLVIAPALIILDETRLAHLQAFVQKGGHLVLTLRSGMKDRTNALLPMRPPGPLAELTGVEVEDFYVLDSPVPVHSDFFQGQAQLWGERLRLREHPASVEVLARYGKANHWLDEQIAITTRPVGAGRVYLVGAYLDPPSQQTLVDHILSQRGIDPRLTPPEVEIRCRVRANGEKVYFVINHSLEVRTLDLPFRAFDHMSERHIDGQLPLAPYQVAILTQEDEP